MWLALVHTYFWCCHHAAAARHEVTMWRRRHARRGGGWRGFKTHMLFSCPYVVFACMPKLHILLVPGVTSRWGMLHEYWVTLYLIGEAKFWRGNADGGEVMVAAAATAEAAAAQQPSSKCERRKSEEARAAASRGLQIPSGRVRVMASPLQFRRQTQLEAASMYCAAASPAAARLPRYCRPPPPHHAAAVFIAMKRGRKTKGDSIEFSAKLNSSFSFFY